MINTHATTGGTFQLSGGYIGYKGSIVITGRPGDSRSFQLAAVLHGRKVEWRLHQEAGSYILTPKMGVLRREE